MYILRSNHRNLSSGPTHLNMNVLTMFGTDGDDEHVEAAAAASSAQVYL
jgi:hypothetical protein